MLVQDFLKALDLIGQVYRNGDGSKPADAIMKLKAQLAGAENLTLSTWASLRTAVGNGGNTPAPLPAPGELDAILKDLENAADNTQTGLAFEKLDALILRADEWRKLAKLATGRSIKTGRAAKDELRSHLANKVQLHNRRDSITRLYP